jgi:TetR/AcrR family transcriptional regulator, cholesterol catabolism regulator
LNLGKLKLFLEFFYLIFMANIGFIIEKAGALFKKYGIKSITMDDISKELGVSKKTLYQLVADKNELIDQFINEGFMDFKLRINKITNSNFDPILELIKIHDLTIEFLLDYSPALEYDLKKYYNGVYEKTEKQFFELFQVAIMNNIEHGKELGLFRDDIDSDFISKIYISGIEHVSKSKIISLDQFVPKKYRNELLTYHLNGLISNDGQHLLLKYLNKDKNKIL